MPMRLTVSAGKSGCASSPFESMRSSNHRSWTWIPALAATTSILPYFAKVDLKSFDIDGYEEISVSTKVAFLAVRREGRCMYWYPLTFSSVVLLPFGVHVGEYHFRTRIDEDFNCRGSNSLCAAWSQYLRTRVDTCDDADLSIQIVKQWIVVRYVCHFPLQNAKAKRGRILKFAVKCGVN